MNEFLILVAFYDKGNTFRERNVKAVINHWLLKFPECDICVSEQIHQNASMFTKEYLEELGPRVKHIVSDDLGETFCKTKLLNKAVLSNEGYKAYVMGDADALPDEGCIDFIRKNWDAASLVFPFSETIYMKELDTRRFITGQPLTPGIKDHGVHVARQTGLCNVFTWDTFKAVGGYDEDFCKWGAEDDAFLVKCARRVGKILRNKGEGTVYHMFHPVVNTPDYIKSDDYVENRKRCACIRRMSDDDMTDYIAKRVSLSELIKKYERLNRLEVKLNWRCTKNSILSIDTTIYDINREGTMTFTRILDEVLKEDGPDYVVRFIDGILLPIPDLTTEQIEEIHSYRNKACSLVKTSEQT